jgi:large subunit ribosomal protein L29
METKELKKKSQPELNRLLRDLRGKLMALRFDLASGKVKNVREIHQLKRDIARILTILREK